MSQGTLEPASAPSESIGRTCEDCGYDLEGVTASVCPECGAPLASSMLALTKRYWTVRQVRFGLTLLLWALPGTAFIYLINVAIDAWLFGTAGANTTDALRIFRPVTASIFVPAMTLLAGAWMLAAPLSDDIENQRLRLGLRAVCILGAVALCILTAHRLIARESGFLTPTTPVFMRTLYFRQVSGWILLALSPFFGFLLLATGGAVARLAGYARTAQAWTTMSMVAAVILALLIAGDAFAAWRWHAPSTSAGAPMPQPPGIYDPERFYFVRALLCAGVGMWGMGIWIALAWLGIQLERVPHPKSV